MKQIYFYLIISLIFTYSCNVLQEKPITDGIIKYSTIWRKSLNPYIITGDVIVSKNATLYIEKGVIIKFKERNKIDSSSLFSKKYYSKRPSLIVFGNIIVSGTKKEPVIFTSDLEKPYRGCWQGIVIDSVSKKQSIIEYANIYWARTGIYINSSSPYIKSCIIKNTKDFGIYGTDACPIIDRNIICNNSIGISINEFSAPIIRNNLFFLNSDYALLMQYPSVVINNIFEKNENALYIGSKNYPIDYNVYYQNLENKNLPFNKNEIIKIKPKYIKSNYKEPQNADWTLSRTSELIQKDEIYINIGPFAKQKSHYSEMFSIDKTSNFGIDILKIDESKQ